MEAKQAMKLKKWDDVYRLPLKGTDFTWVYDSNDNFVFQFLTEKKDLQEKVLKCINGEMKPTEKIPKFIHENGYIKIENGSPLILIRGWGNLTGSGAMNLPFEDAKNIQDTFAEFIISRLTP